MADEIAYAYRELIEADVYVIFFSVPALKPVLVRGDLVHEILARLDDEDFAVYRWGQEGVRLLSCDPEGDDVYEPYLAGARKPAADMFPLLDGGFYPRDIVYAEPFNPNDLIHVMLAEETQVSTLHPYDFARWIVQKETEGFQ